MPQELPEPVVVNYDDSKSELGAQAQKLTRLIHDGVIPGIGFSLGVVNVDPGHFSRSHTHENSDIVVYIVSGHAASLSGEDLRPHFHRPGTACWIGAGVPHAAVNLSTTEPVLGVEFRTDPAFNDDVRTRPDLQWLVERRAAELQDGWADLQRDTAVTVTELREAWERAVTAQFPGRQPAKTFA
ncbi:cupin domain-containing protein [Amycolatopsis minnesotensis]|uniref:Cupin type-2 domain-containing protein n=1 Tax=Amycolatopsis minnesotensis TaxID=337894 RepID=A0ABP5CTG2_9PSEU